MKFEKINEFGNANVIIQKSIPAIKLAMIRLEDIFDFYSEEPNFITIKKSNNSSNFTYEQILRIRIWRIKGESYSWCIYATDRQQFKSIIIRKVTWNMEDDKKEIKNYAKSNREKIYSAWPTITIYNNYINSSNSNEIINIINELDLLIKRGIILHDNTNSTWEWRELELRRLYDWGKIESVWCANKQNKAIEKKVKILVSKLDFMLNNKEILNNIYSMVLNYSILPEKYKNVFIDKL